MADEDWNQHLDHLVFRKETLEMLPNLGPVLPDHLKEIAEKTTICVICTECMRKDLHVTCCGHVFHSKCLSKWFHVCHKSGQLRVCPICRSIQKNKSIPLFFEFEGIHESEVSFETHLKVVRDYRVSMLMLENQNLRDYNERLIKEKNRLSKEFGELIGKNMRLKQKLKIYKQSNTNQMRSTYGVPHSDRINLIRNKNNVEKERSEISISKKESTIKFETPLIVPNSLKISKKEWSIVDMLSKENHTPFYQTVKDVSSNIPPFQLLNGSSKMGMNSMNSFSYLNHKEDDQSTSSYSTQDDQLQRNHSSDRLILTS